MSKSRPQKQTLLLVGEGYDEEAFLKYLKSQLVGREAGLEVKIKNAKGKGAKHVIEWTIRQAKQAEYDVVAALFDTDTDWSAAVQKQAKAKKIVVLASEPCFEAMLLRLHGVTPEFDNKKLKKQFEPYVNGAAAVLEHYAAYFNPDILKSKRHQEKTIDVLLKLLKA
ncbi:MAG: RloB domain-containing protein [Gammaproteobacteria bacterium]|nr:RloB domain-containing protein [Gammaproteobacteria bacterium]